MNSENIPDQSNQYKSFCCTLVENLTDSIFMVDNTMRVVFINKHAAAKFNLDKKDIVGKHINKLFLKETAERQINQLKKAFTEGKIINTITYVEFPTGKLWLDNKIIPVKDDNNKVEYVFGVSRNITKQKEFEEELVRYKNNLEELLNSKEKELENKSELLDKSTIVFAGREIAITTLKNRIKELEGKLKK